MMIRKMLVLTCAFALAGVGSSALAGDCKVCDKVAKTGHGFCHGKGKAYGVQLTSEVTLQPGATNQAGSGGRWPVVR